MLLEVFFEIAGITDAQLVIVVRFFRPFSVGESAGTAHERSGVVIMLCVHGEFDHIDLFGIGYGIDAQTRLFVVPRDERQFFFGCDVDVEAQYFVALDENTGLNDSLRNPAVVCCYRGSQIAGICVEDVEGQRRYSQIARIFAEVSPLSRAPTIMN